MDDNDRGTPMTQDTPIWLVPQADPEDDSPSCPPPANAAIAGAVSAGRAMPARSGGGESASSASKMDEPNRTWKI